MNWGRESRSNRCSHLFGIKKDQYRLSRHRLHQQVHIWYDAPFSEVLLDQNSFPLDRSRILHRHNEGIARWLDQQHAFSDAIVAHTKRNTGQLLILSFCGTPDSRRQHNSSFQTRLQDARQAHLPTSIELSQTSEGDHSHGGRPPAEEPPD